MAASVGSDKSENKNWTTETNGMEDSELEDRSFQAPLRSNNSAHLLEHEDLSQSAPVHHQARQLQSQVGRLDTTSQSSARLATAEAMVSLSQSEVVPLDADQDLQPLSQADYHLRGAATETAAPSPRATAAEVPLDLSQSTQSAQALMPQHEKWEFLKKVSEQALTKVLAESIASDRAAALTVETMRAFHDWQSTFIPRLKELEQERNSSQELGPDSLRDMTTIFDRMSLESGAGKSKREFQKAVALWGSARKFLISEVTEMIARRPRVPSHQDSVSPAAQGTLSSTAEHSSAEQENATDTPRRLSASFEQRDGEDDLAKPMRDGA